MSVSLDSTIAGADANSYVTLAEMTAFIENRIVCAAVTAWNTLTDDNKERYLIKACEQIDSAHRWLGSRVTDKTGDDSQALEFPRFSLDTRGGKANIQAYRAGGPYAIDERVKQAQMIQALYLCQKIEVDGDADPVGGSTRAKLQAEGVKSISVGNMAETYTGKTNALCDEAERLLRPLVRRHHVI